MNPLESFARAALTDILASHPAERVRKIQNLLVFTFWRGLMLGAAVGAVATGVIIALLRVGWWRP